MIGLSPMDGITDSAFRQIVDEVGKPDILFTEFVPVAGLSKGRSVLLNGLVKHSSKTLTIAQFFGNEPEFFSNAFFIAAALGFSGVDVNMGCPDLSIVKKGGGAGLIKTPKIAQEIMHILHKARQDLINGKRLSETTVPLHMQMAIKKLYKGPHAKNMTLSIKTRIGFDRPITKDWIGQLLEVSPDFISLHGRIFTQKYAGLADWEEIGTAVTLAKKSHTKILGNGDVKSISEAKEKIQTYHVDGILIGRAALGNPWIFADTLPTKKERISTITHHAKLFLTYRPDLDLRPMRKHFAWYCKNELGHPMLRRKMMEVVTLTDLLRVLELA